MLSLFELHLHLLHLLAGVLLRPDRVALVQHLEAEDDKERASQEVGVAFRDHAGYRVTQDGGENGHGDQGGEGRREDEQSRVLHGHERRDQERLVAYLREEDHGQGEEGGMKGLDEAFGGRRRRRRRSVDRRVGPDQTERIGLG